MTDRLRGVNIPRTSRGLATLVHDARIAQGLTQADAYRRAAMGRSTWEKIERGEQVREDNYGKIEQALGWKPNSIIRWLRNGGPVPGEPDVATVRQMTPRDIIENLDLPSRLKKRLLFDLDEFYGDDDS